MVTTEQPLSHNGAPAHVAVPNFDGLQDPQNATVDVSSAKIMIVDDEPTNIKVVRRLLEIEGYRNFVTTTDSSAALYLLSDQRPDLVLLDLMMPIVSGLEILANVRGDSSKPFVPIIILTAATD